MLLGWLNSGHFLAVLWPFSVRSFLGSFEHSIDILLICMKTDSANGDILFLLLELALVLDLVLL